MLPESLRPDTAYGGGLPHPTPSHGKGVGKGLHQQKSARYVHQHQLRLLGGGDGHSSSPEIAAPSRAPTATPFTVTEPVAGTR